MFDFQGTAKWNSWTEVKGMAKDEAQKKYIELVKSLLNQDSTKTNVVPGL